MSSYKAPDFTERAALARQAKQKALDVLRSRPAPTEEELAECKAAALKREAQAEEKRQAKREAMEREKAERAERAAAAEAAKAEAEAALVKTEAQKKAERDARYAARKNRK